MSDTNNQNQNDGDVRPQQPGPYDSAQQVGSAGQTPVDQESAQPQSAYSQPTQPQQQQPAQQPGTQQPAQQPAQPQQPAQQPSQPQQQNNSNNPSNTDNPNNTVNPNGPVPPTYEPNRRPGAAIPGFGGGMKAAWAAMGFLLGIFSLPLAFIVYSSRGPVLRNQAIKWSLVGIAITFVVYIIVFLSLGGDFSSLFAASGTDTSATTGSSSTQSQSSAF